MREKVAMNEGTQFSHEQGKVKERKKMERGNKEGKVEGTKQGRIQGWKKLT